MIKQIYFNRIEKAIKIIRTYDIMINGQGNYKTLPHYMKVFGDYCMDYLKYKVVEVEPEMHHTDDIYKVLASCKENGVELIEGILDHIELVEKARNAQYTDVSECIALMPVTEDMIRSIAQAVGLDMD